MQFLPNEQQPDIARAHFIYAAVVQPYSLALYYPICLHWRVKTLFRPLDWWSREQFCGVFSKPRFSMNGLIAFTLPVFGVAYPSGQCNLNVLNRVEGTSSSVTIACKTDGSYPDSPFTMLHVTRAGAYLHHAYVALG